MSQYDARHGACATGLQLVWNILPDLIMPMQKTCALSHTRGLFYYSKPSQTFVFPIRSYLQNLCRLSDLRGLLLPPGHGEWEGQVQDPHLRGRMVLQPGELCRKVQKQPRIQQLLAPDCQHGLERVSKAMEPRHVWPPRQRHQERLRQLGLHLHHVLRRVLPDVLPQGPDVRGHWQQHWQQH